MIYEYGTVEYFVWELKRLIDEYPFLPDDLLRTFVERVIRDSNYVDVYKVIGGVPEFQGVIIRLNTIYNQIKNNINILKSDNINKPYLFYFFCDAQQGEERAGGRYEDYHIVYNKTIEDAFAEYVKWYNQESGSTCEVKDYSRMSYNCWHNYFSIYCLELPYDVYDWDSFNPLSLCAVKNPNKIPHSWCSPVTSNTKCMLNDCYVSKTIDEDIKDKREKFREFMEKSDQSSLTSNGIFDTSMDDTTRNAREISQRYTDNYFKTVHDVTKPNINKIKNALLIAFHKGEK